MEEDMEIYHIVNVPDTPDRSNAWKSDRKCVGNPEKMESVFPVAGEASNSSNYITVSPSKKSYHSQNGPIFRRAQSEKVIRTTHPSGDQKIEKGKAISSKFPAKQSHHGCISSLDLTDDKGQFKQPKPGFLHHASRGKAIEDKKELRACSGSSSLPSISDSSNTSGNGFTGKCKLDSKTLPGPNIFMDRGKSISVSTDSQSELKAEKQISLPHHLFNAPRGRGHKRLVRNGCISPHNIAIRAKQSADQSSLQTNYVEQSHAGHAASSNTMSPPITVDDIVAEERGGDRGKGKEVLSHPSSHGIHDGTIHSDNSCRVINYIEANGISNATRNSLEKCEGQGGWRTTHNEENAGQHWFDMNGQHSRKNYAGRFINRQNMNRIDRSDTGSSQNAKDVPGSSSDHTRQSASLSIPEIRHSTRPRHTADSLTKRQRKREALSGNPNEASHNSEIILLNSSGESSSSSRSRVMNPELVELLSTPSFTNRLSEDLDDNDNTLDARARQLEADEILARQLQEQLYRDEFFEGAGIDEHFAWEMQHTDNLLHSSIDSRNTSHPTLLPRENRQPRSRLPQNPSNRRRNVPPVPFSSRRMSQLRNRMINRPSAAVLSSRGRRPQFPLDMDLDMRLDILEALEDAVGDFNDMGMTDDIFNAHRDFNEADYEMLLALDEQNHQHTGASAHQINSLPQSTIQTDNFTEACAVCLDTPVKGEIIRHLPCLHKFHKDCIDPWLQRKTSCPVCKSSIT